MVRRIPEGAYICADLRVGPLVHDDDGLVHIRHQGRGEVDEVNPCTPVGRRDECVGVGLVDDVLEVGFLEDDVLGNQEGVVFCEFIVAVVEAGAGIAVPEKDLSVAGILPAVDGVFDYVIHLELTVVVSLVGCGTGFPCSIA